jgi:hypothetical protein
MEQTSFNSIWERPEELTLRRKAALWIERNPHIFARFEYFAIEMARKEKRFGMKLLGERVRWELLITIEKDAEGFRLNNNLISYLGRELVRRHPELAEFIEFRKCADEKNGVKLEVRAV